MSLDHLRRIALFGSAEFAIPSLHVLSDRFDLVALYSQPPQPAGRKQRLHPTPFTVAAEQLGMTVRTPTTLAGIAAELQQLEVDVGVVVAYGGLLPPDVLAAPRYGFLNVHPSLLPRWRGAAPVQRAILAGDTRTGVTIIRVVAELDAGPIARAEQVPIMPGEITGNLEPLLGSMGADLLVPTIRGVVSKRQKFWEQDATQVTYAQKLRREEEAIDWRRPAIEIGRQVWALSPQPGAWTTLGNDRIRVLDAGVEHASGPAGTALDDQLLIACGVNGIRIKRLQRAGKKPMSAAEFLRGFSVPAGVDLIADH